LTIDTIVNQRGTIALETGTIVNTIDPVSTQTAPVASPQAAPRDRERDLLRSTVATTTTTVSLVT
jgi:hypothetical protein